MLNPVEPAEPAPPAPAPAAAAAAVDDEDDEALDEELWRPHLAGFRDAKNDVVFDVGQLNRDRGVEFDVDPLDCPPPPPRPADEDVEDAEPKCVALLINSCITDVEEDAPAVVVVVSTAAEESCFDLDLCPPWLFLFGGTFRFKISDILEVPPPVVVVAEEAAAVG